MVIGNTENVLPRSRFLNGSYCERSRVMIDTYADPTLVASQVINTVGRHFSQLLDFEVVNSDLFGQEENILNKRVTHTFIKVKR